MKTHTIYDLEKALGDRYHADLPCSHALARALGKARTVVDELEDALLASFCREICVIYVSEKGEEGIRFLPSWIGQEIPDVLEGLVDGSEWVLDSEDRSRLPIPRWEVTLNLADPLPENQNEFCCGVRAWSARDALIAACDCMSRWAGWRHHVRKGTSMEAYEITCPDGKRVGLSKIWEVGRGDMQDAHFDYEICDTSGFEDEEDIE